MTEKNTYWLRDAEGTSALVTGADERDRLVTQGWTETDEPTDGFVYVWHEGNEKPGRAPVALLREVLSHTGWVPGPPEGGERPAAATPDVPAQPSGAAAKSTSKPAAGGNEKE